VTLNFPDIGLKCTWSQGELAGLLDRAHSVVAPRTLDSEIVKSVQKLAEPFAKKEFQHVAVLAFLYLYVSLAKPGVVPGDVTFYLRSAIPIGSGLGSSASISVCLATALLLLYEYVPRPAGHDPATLKTINDWAHLGEKCIHGNPSGVDNTVATFGGGVVFRKERRERKLSNGTFTPNKPAEKVIIE
jgi:mevalonate kinase